MNDMNITIIMDCYLLQLEANKIATNFTTIVITSSSLMHKVVWQTLYEERGQRQPFVHYVPIGNL